MIWVSKWKSIEERYAHEEEMRDFQSRFDLHELLSPNRRDRRREGIRENERCRLQDHEVYGERRLLKIKEVRGKQLERIHHFLDILEILIRHLTNPLGEVHARTAAAQPLRRQLFLYLAVAKRETLQQWDDTAALYDVASRCQKIRGLRDGYKGRWGLSEICVTKPRHEDEDKLCVGSLGE
jgi:hypothetical protein